MKLRLLLALVLLLTAAGARAQQDAFGTSWQYAQGEGFHLAVSDAPAVLRLADRSLLHVLPVLDTGSTGYRYRLRVYKTDTVGNLAYRRDFYYHPFDTVAFQRMVSAVENDSGHVAILYATSRTIFGQANLGLLVLDGRTGAPISNVGYGRSGGAYEQPHLRKYGRYEYVVSFGSFRTLSTVVMRLSSRGRVLASTQFTGQGPVPYYPSGSPGLEVYGSRIYLATRSNILSMPFAPALLTLTGNLSVVRAALLSNPVTGYVPSPMGLHKLPSGRLLLAADSVPGGGGLLTAGSFVVLDTTWSPVWARGYKDTLSGSPQTGQRLAPGDVAVSPTGLLMQEGPVSRIGLDGTPRRLYREPINRLGRAYFSSLPLPALGGADVLLPGTENRLYPEIGRTVRYLHAAALDAAPAATPCGADTGRLQAITHTYSRTAGTVNLRPYTVNAVAMPRLREETPDLCRLPYCFTMGDYVGDSSTCADTITVRVPRVLEGQITRWSNGDTGLTARLRVPGSYTLYLGTRCFTFADSFRLAKTFPPIDLAGDSLIRCYGDTIRAQVRLTTPGTVAWALSTAPQDTLSTDTTVRFALYPRGYGRLQAWLRVRANQQGCVSADSVPLSVVSRLPHILPDTVRTCQADTLLDASRLLGFAVPFFGTTWHGPDGTVSTDPHNALLPGRYRVEFPYLGCPQRDSLNVKFEVLPGTLVPELPVGAVTYPGRPAEPDTAAFPPPVPIRFRLPAGAADISWQQGESGPFEPGAAELAFAALTVDSTLYACARYTLDGCHYAACLRLAVHPTGAAWPTLVTPNGDGRNDRLATFPDPLPGSIRIYNRWGRTVLQDGNYAGTWPTPDTPPGLYFFHHASLTGVVYKGWVEVAR